MQHRPKRVAGAGLAAPARADAEPAAVPANNDAEIRGDHVGENLAIAT